NTEHQHEDLVDVDAQRIDHGGILDACTHDHADTRAVKHKVERDQGDDDNAEQRQAVGWIEHEPERRDADQPSGWRYCLRQTAEEEPHGFNEHDAETECDEQLVFMRSLVKMPYDHALQHHADQHDEQRASHHGDDERARIGIREPTRIATEHEHG